MPQVTKDDLNGVFQRADGSLWRLVSYAEQPTCTWEAVEGERSQGGRGHAVEFTRVNAVVGSPLAGEFTRLVPAA